MLATGWAEWKVANAMLEVGPTAADQNPAEIASLVFAQEREQKVAAQSEQVCACVFLPGLFCQSSDPFCTIVLCVARPKRIWWR